MIRAPGTLTAQCYPPDDARRPKYSRCGTRRIPDIGINAEIDRSKVGGGTKTLFPNCRLRTPIQDQELKDKDPGLTCLGGERERNHQRRGQESPQLEVCPEPSNRRKPDILQPHTPERAISENPRRGSLGSSTKIRRIANRSNGLVSDKIHRPEEGTYKGLTESLVAILATQVVAPTESLKTGWKARMIARRLAQLRAAQVASFEAGGFIWIN